MTQHQKNEILHQLSMQGNEDLGLYLGMPFVIGKSGKRNCLHILLTGFGKKTHGWKDKLLSKGGEGDTY